MVTVAPLLIVKLPGMETAPLVPVAAARLSDIDPVLTNVPPL